MANMLHGSARTTPRIRAELQRSKEKTSTLAQRYGLSRTTVTKWRTGTTTSEAPMGPAKPSSTVLSPAEDHPFPTPATSSSSAAAPKALPWPARWPARARADLGAGQQCAAHRHPGADGCRGRGFRAQRLPSPGRLALVSAAAGGSSAINNVTAVVPPLPLFLRHGIDLHPALEALRTEMPMQPLPDRLVGPMARRLMRSAVAVGHACRKFDKMIFAAQCCAGCWRCAYGCPFGAKWTARNFVDATIRHGAQILSGAISSSSRAFRVVASGSDVFHRLFPSRLKPANSEKFSCAWPLTG